MAFGLFLITPRVWCEETSQCLSKSAVTEVAARYDFHTEEEVNGSPAERFAPCDPSSLSYKTFSALIFLRTLKHPVAGLEQWAQSCGGSPCTPDQLLNRHFHTIVFSRSSQSYCTEPGVAAYAAKDALHICPQAKGSTITYLASALIHEARHLDNPKFRHVQCPRGPLKNLEMCDDSFSQEGPYAFQTAFLLSLLKSEGLPADFQIEARIEAYDLIVNHFRILPWGVRPGVLFQGRDGRLSFFDGRELEDVKVEPVSPDSLMANRFGMPVFFDARNRSAKAYIFSSRLVDVTGAYARNFKSAKTPPKILAISFCGEPCVPDKSRDDYSCQLFRDQLLCNPTLDPSSRLVIPFDDKRPTAFVNLGARRGIVWEDGNVSLLPMNYRELSRSNAAQWPRVSNPHRLIRAAPVPLLSGKTAILGLTDQGVVVIATPDLMSTEPMPQCAGMRPKEIIGPVWYSRELVDILGAHR